jgi:hypothetical protein
MASPTKLTAAQIEQIVNLEIPAPHTHANLTYPAGIRFLREQIAAALEKIPADEVVTREVVLRDGDGRPVLDANGNPKFVKQSVFTRELGSHASRLYQQLLKGQQDEWREYLQRSNREHEREGQELQRALKAEFKEHLGAPDCRGEIDAFTKAWLATPDELRSEFEANYAAGAGPRPLLPAQAAE